MFGLINLVFVLPQMVICGHTAETFVSLRDMGIPITGEYLC